MHTNGHLQPLHREDFATGLGPKARSRPWELTAVEPAAAITQGAGDTPWASVEETPHWTLVKLCKNAKTIKILLLPAPALKSFLWLPANRRSNQHWSSWLRDLKMKNAKDCGSYLQPPWANSALTATAGTFATPETWKQARYFGEFRFFQVISGAISITHRQRTVRPTHAAPKLILVPV